MPFVLTHLSPRYTHAIHTPFNLQEGLSAGVSTDALKAKGNAFFSKGKFEEAVDAFSDCIAVDPASAVFYSNRSAAHAKLGKVTRS